MSRKRSRFETEVHLGFLAIVCLLLSLNFVSNYIIFRARSTNYDHAAAYLRTAGLAISRAVQEASWPGLSESRRQELAERYNLSEIILVPSQPSDDSPGARRRWFASVASRLPVGQLPQLAEKLLTADFQELARGEGDEYFYVYPLRVGAGHNLLILSINRPDLAYLDDSRRLMLIAFLGSLAVVFLVYLMLLRFIFAPFRKIREQAARVGRTVEDGENEAEAVVAEYRKVIERLQQKEAELMRLNASIQNRADSLEQFNEYLLASSSSGIITLDRQGLVLSLNDSARRILRIQSEHYVGADYCTLLSTYGQLVEQIALALDDEVFHGYRECTLEVQDNDDKVVGVSISPIRDNTRQMVGVSVLLNDLTELIRLRSELEQKDRMVALGEMAGGLAHQLRNSMGAISGYGKLMERKLIGDSQSTENIEALLRETHEAENLIHRFLSFAQPLTFWPSPVKIDELIREVTASFQVREDCKTIDFSLSHKGCQTIEADAALLKQAISNLVDNSIQAYSEREGIVRISSSEVNNGILIVVEDHGCGIADDELKKVFTPFFSSRPSGTGLGLPLTRKIIDLHKGQITVKSELGKGTTFRILLPSARVRQLERETLQISGQL